MIEYDGYPPDKDDLPLGDTRLWANVYDMNGDFVTTQPWQHDTKIEFTVRSPRIITSVTLTDQWDNVVGQTELSPLITAAKGDKVSINMTLVVS